MAGKALLGLLLAAGLGSAKADEAYTLGPKDKLAIGVGHWDVTEARYVAWEGVAGIYTVGPDGSISIPILGSVPAAGLTPAALGEKLGDLYRRQLGASDPISVTAAVEEFRPIYVVGNVREPGALPFEPGMTVIQALASAGGTDRPDIFVRADREALQAMGEIGTLRADLARGLVRKARLEAEINDRETIELPEGVDGVPVDAIVETEEEILEAHNEAFRSSLEQLTSLESLMTARIQKLEEQIELRQRQVELARAELKNIRSLTDRGLAVASRELSTARTVADLESGVLELESEKIEVEQKLAELARSRIDLISERRGTLLEALGDTQSEIARLEIRIDNQESIYLEALRWDLGTVDEQGMPPAARFFIARGEGEPATLAAEATTRLRPGDVLEVRVPVLHMPPSSRRGADAAPVPRPSAKSAAADQAGGGD